MRVFGGGFHHRAHGSLTAATQKIVPATRRAGTRVACRVSEGGRVFVGRHARRRIAGRVPLTLTGAAHANRGTLVATATAHAHGHAGRLNRCAFGILWPANREQSVVSAYAPAPQAPMRRERRRHSWPVSWGPRRRWREIRRACAGARRPWPAGWRR